MWLELYAIPPPEINCGIHNSSAKDASANRAATAGRDRAALPSDAAPDPDFGGPGGMARWQSTESLAFAFACYHRGELAFPQPCRTAKSGSGGTASQGA